MGCFTSTWPSCYKACVLHWVIFSSCVWEKSFNHRCMLFGALTQKHLNTGRYAIFSSTTYLFILHLFWVHLTSSVRLLLSTIYLCFFSFLQSLSRWWLPSEESSDLSLCYLSSWDLSLRLKKKKNNNQTVNKPPRSLICRILRFVLQCI